MAWAEFKPRQNKTPVARCCCFSSSGTTWFRFDKNKKSRKFSWTLWSQAVNTGLTIIQFSGELLNFFVYLCICMSILIINLANLLQDEDLWIFLAWCCASTGAAPTEATELFFSPRLSWSTPTTFPAHLGKMSALWRILTLTRAIYIYININKQVPHPPVHSSAASLLVPSLRSRMRLPERGGANPPPR